jgi:glycosyltransferase involved in cell wall biosynthesis
MYTSEHRPFWSVMIPTYNPDPRYLRETLESVLVQDPGPSQMQIEVIDDASPESRTAALVREIAGDRVRVHQLGTNLGLARVWNQCIERAHGDWVHILHQDDWVLFGFYRHLQQGLMDYPEAGMAFTRHLVADEHSHWRGMSAIERETPGILEDAKTRLAGDQRIQFPAAVVKKSVYLELGGFRDDLVYALDWEMWARVASFYAVFFEPRALAIYRMHSASETKRLQKAGVTVPDISKCIEINCSRLPKTQSLTIEAKAKKVNAMMALDQAWFLLVNRQFAATRSVISAAIASSRNPAVCLKLVMLFARAGVMWLSTPVRKVLRSAASCM